MAPDPTAVADIDPEEAQRVVSAGVFLLDVREDDEWDAGHAPAAVHVAMGEVVGRIAEIPADRTLICICRVGGRSGAVANVLAGEGYDVRNLHGGMLAWELAGLPVVTDSGDPGRIL